MEKYHFNGFYFYKGIWIKMGGKEINQEFLMYYYVSDIVHILSKHQKSNYFKIINR
jgi:hypothetical protein